LDKNDDIIKKVKKTVLAIVPDAEIILFGSSGQGDGKDSNSGWKLLILIDQTLARDLIITITDHLYQVGSEIGIPFGSTVVPKKDWNSPNYPNQSFKQMIETDGTFL